MKIEDMPKVRLSLQQMEYVMVETLQEHWVEMKETIRPHIEKAVKNYNFEDDIRRFVQIMIMDSVDEYFRNPDSKARAEIKRLVRDVMERMIHPRKRKKECNQS